ncbi:MAG: transglutaminase domain-containing protein [Tannerella sp.]|nr:transglutaminase domain-containing protein [Tannerella sp.]
MLLLAGCSYNNHFIADKDYRVNVEQTFESKKLLFGDASLFPDFDKETTLREQEAMKFLYAYMPVGDITDYDVDFYLKNVRSSFESQQYMPWGKDIPEKIFRHFVLPVRVNNENLDESRMIFYEELKDRVKGMTLSDAALEVNHWCHEKVVYTPSDSRTSSPLASVKTAYGRCGEESTFAVAALRSVGIPARQVYTPRWAHTDDNHAWVEVYVDGKWYFMGACEPEPVLNLGWFNAPASRGMLMHTKVFGYYDGPEEIMEQTACYTEINVIDNYAPTAKTVVTVKNSADETVEGATVEFKLYNYAEFYSVARKTTDKNGCCSLSAGKGDMLIWATKDGRFGYSKLSFGKTDSLTIVLDKAPGYTATVELDIVPPPEGNIPVEVSAEQRKENELRTSREDSIRNVYVETFYTEEKTNEAAKKYGPEAAEFLVKSRGNYSEIERFLQETPDSMKIKAISLLKTVSGKDLRDTKAETLIDHLQNTPDIAGNDSELLFVRNVLNPRVSNELLTPYRKFFTENMGESFIGAVRKEPQQLVEWVGKYIRVRDDLNPQNIPIMPTGVWKARMGDSHSRDVFFVSMARSAGIPARIERVTGKVQFYDKKWTDVNFDAAEQTNANQGFIEIAYKPSKTADYPKYRSHFTIARLLPDARLQTLGYYTGGNEDMGGDGSQGGIFRKPGALDEGAYILVTGTRMASGKILTRITFFAVNKDETTPVEFVMREDIDDIRVIGSIDAEAKYAKADGGDETSILNTTGRGYFIVGILGARQEPTNHALRDIERLKAGFENWNRSIILLFKNDRQLQLFDKNEFANLPATVVYGIDNDDRIAKMIAEATKLTDKEALPIFVIADTFGRVIFVSQGYTIGLGEQMMKVINKL